jgi:hypothetical protein
VLPRLAEQVAYACSTDADEHLDEVRPGDRVERHAGLARDRTREQRLTGAGRSDEQHALRHLAAEALELAGFPKILDDLREVLFGLVDARDICESRVMRAGRQQARARPAEACGPAGLPRTASPREEQHADNQRANQQGFDERVDKESGVAGDGLDPDAVAQQSIDHRRIGGGRGAKICPVDQCAGDTRAIDPYTPNLTALHVRHEIRIGQLAGA